MEIVDRTSVRKIKIEEAQNDFLYWQGQPYEKRLEALESISREYNSWKYGEDQEFQRVYRIIKQK